MRIELWLEGPGGASSQRWVGTLDKSYLFLGRSGCCVVIDDKLCSRRHAVLYLDSDAKALCLKDLGSKHGTWLNGRRVKSALLNPGDSLRLGNTVVRLDFDPWVTGLVRLDERPEEGA